MKEYSPLERQKISSAWRRNGDAQKPSDTLVKDAREHIAYCNKYMPGNLEKSLLSVGVRVRHEYLGEGSILDIDTGKGAYLVQFDSTPTPRTISFRVKLIQI